MNDDVAGAYRPEILQPSDEHQCSRLTLLMARPDIEQLDVLREQIADLIRTRHPGQQFQPDQLDAATEDFLLANGGDRYGNWVHYPWSRRLVRLLPEAEFVELRTDRNKQKITDAEQSSLARRCIGVVGLSVGQSVALTLAMERTCSQLRLADFDTIDLSNLNRLRCGVHNLGLPKTVAAAREIAELDPYLDVICFSQGYTDLTADEFMDGLELVVDECDSNDVKVTLREAARTRRIPLLMSTSDRGMIDIERFDLEPDRPIFHGRMRGLSAAQLRDLTTVQKIPILMDLAGLPDASLRMRASLLEIGHSIKTWPQLASDVTFGGAAICDVARRTLLDQPIASGCYRMDFNALGDPANALPVDRPPPLEWPPARPHRAADIREEILLDAIQAPSAGNSQPWHWRKIIGGLSLDLMPRYRSTVLYAGNRADYVALGASLETAVIAARHRGFHVVERIQTDKDHIASLQLTPGAASGAEPLYEQITRRRSVRTRPATINAIPDVALDRMRAQVESVPGIQLRWLNDSAAIAELAELTGQAERLRILDPVSHAELIENELCWNESRHQSHGTGIPMSALSLSAAELAGLEFIRDPDVISSLARWNGGNGMKTLGNELIRTSSALGLIWSNSDTLATYLDGGRALQRLWLQATADDIGMCPMATLCYLIATWRRGQLATQMQRDALPDMEKRFRALFDLPESRSDIAVFRLVPADGHLRGERSTRRLPLRDVTS